MKTKVNGKSAPRAMVLALGIAILPGSTSLGDDGPGVAAQKVEKSGKIFPKKRPTTQGTLGYGPPGLHPGFQGFGLGYHPGYGYGGAALGVGAEGGYPFYGGPGYPHPAPPLRRIGPVAPFAFFGGPGGPTPTCPNFFGGVGPLAPDQPVVRFLGETPESGYAGGYGEFNGSIPYPESTFAPFTTAAGDEAKGESKPPTPPMTQPPIPPVSVNAETPDASKILGLETMTVVDDSLARGLKITSLRPGGEAEKAGLRVGDVIRSANGYLTEQPGNLTWIVTNATPEHVLNVNVLSASDGEARTITVKRP